MSTQPVKYYYAPWAGARPVHANYVANACFVGVSAPEGRTEEKGWVDIHPRPFYVADGCTRFPAADVTVYPRKGGLAARIEDLQSPDAVHFADVVAREDYAFCIGMPVRPIEDEIDKWEWREEHGTEFDPEKNDAAWAWREARRREESRRLAMYWRERGVAENCAKYTQETGMREALEADMREAAVTEFRASDLGAQRLRERDAQRAWRAQLRGGK